MTPYSIRTTYEYLQIIIVESTLNYSAQPRQDTWFSIIIPMSESVSDSVSDHSGNSSPADAATPSANKVPQRYLLPILYLTNFLFLYGENIQPAPRSQIHEHIICRRLHGDIDTGNIVLYSNICKSPDVQEERAYLRGMDRLLKIFPSNTSFTVSQSDPTRIPILSELPLSHPSHPLQSPRRPPRPHHNPHPQSPRTLPRRTMEFPHFLIFFIHAASPRSSRCLPRNRR